MRAIFTLFALLASAQIASAQIQFDAFCADDSSLVCAAFDTDECTYEEARFKAIKEGKPLLVFLGYSDYGPVSGCILHYVRFSDQTKQWAGYPYGSIVASAPYGGELYYRGTFGRRSEINVRRLLDWDEPMKVGSTFTTRAPQGHTHTCSNGHTWDHAANPSHTCEFCGQSQYVQDRTPQPVTVRPALARSQPVVATQSLQSSGSCASGSCPSSSAPSRLGLFRR